MVDSAQNRLLFIEDDEPYAHILTAQLRLNDTPFHVTHVSNLSAALRHLSAQPVDAVLMDLGLPDSKSLETLKSVRQRNADAAIIVLTGEDDETLGLQAVREGAQDFVVKGKTRSKEIARLLRFAIERQNSQRRLTDLSLHDELTQVYNRRGFLTVAEHQIRRAFREKHEILCFYFDLNNLKETNDTQGHEVGDRMIRDFSEILKSTLRGSDVIGRIGGDEFVALTSRTPKENSATLVERLKKKIEAHNSEASDSPPLAASVGLSCFDPDNPLPLDELMTAADKAMYHSKQSGEGDLRWEPGVKPQ